MKDRRPAGWSASRHFLSPAQHPGPFRRRLSEPRKIGLIEATKSRTEAPENGETRKVLELASKIEAMALDAVRDRYHELIDERPNLSSIERFELKRIKERLDREDFDADQKARDRDWEERRTAVLDSIEELIDRLRQSNL
jgi:hypothetical protein